MEIYRFTLDLDTLIYDLHQYTGMTPQEVYDAINPSRTDNQATWDDFNFVNPKSNTEVVWYNRINRTFLFECALHPPWKELEKIQPGSIVLDYGAGLGTDCFWLYMSEYNPVYFEINLAEKDFFKWRCSKYSIDIPIVEPFVENVLNYTECFLGPYDVVILRDVLEHIPDYVRVLEGISNGLNEGGEVYIQAPFGEKELGVHMREKWPVSDWMVNHGFRKIDGIRWRKGM